MQAMADGRNMTGKARVTRQKPPKSSAERRSKQDIDPVLKAWIDNVIVPMLVEEYLREDSKPKPALPHAS